MSKVQSESKIQPAPLSVEPQQMKNSTAAKTALIDLVWVLSTLYVLKYAFLQFHSFWTYAGPISLLASLAVATWRLKRNNQTWQSIGFIHDSSHLKLTLWTVGALVLTILMGNVASQIAEALVANPEALSEQSTNYMQNRFAEVPGNLGLYLMWIAISWLIGGFTEELLFRGFLINRFENLFSKIPFAIVFAILFQALIFGQQHMYYQGVVGLVSTGIIGIVSGVIYVLCKRRLWALILSHGLANTLGMTMLYLS
ncbi:MAG: CPBP family intramembrane metalloprotease [Kangiellaceae bacterium]|nr:CPBP family intramembrane metalloprotease [Kangiellaceae bacterium]MCW8997490.1 CPBP family intramembrane metalloprotease [Kangiellaceae bacterium]